jgi:hypothetical protein
VSECKDYSFFNSIRAFSPKLLTFNYTSFNFIRSVKYLGSLINVLCYKNCSLLDVVSLPSFMVIWNNRNRRKFTVRENNLFISRYIKYLFI